MFIKNLRLPKPGVAARISTRAYSFAHLLLRRDSSRHGVRIWAYDRSAYSMRGVNVVLNFPEDAAVYAVASRGGSGGSSLSYRRQQQQGGRGRGTKIRRRWVGRSVGRGDGGASLGRHLGHGVLPRRWRCRCWPRTACASSRTARAARSGTRTRAPRSYARTMDLRQSQSSARACPAGRTTPSTLGLSS